jgi:hypothetical protein
VVVFPTPPLWLATAITTMICPSFYPKIAQPFPHARGYVQCERHVQMSVGGVLDVYLTRDPRAFDP